MHLCTLSFRSPFLASSLMCLYNLLFHRQLRKLLCYHHHHFLFSFVFPMMVRHFRHRLLLVIKLPCLLVPDAPRLHHFKVVPGTQHALHAASILRASARPSYEVRQVFWLHQCQQVLLVLASLDLYLVPRPFVQKAFHYSPYPCEQQRRIEDEHLSHDLWVVVLPYFGG